MERLTTAQVNSSSSIQSARSKGVKPSPCSKASHWSHFSLLKFSDFKEIHFSEV